MPHPNSLANLKPPWQSGTQPRPGVRYIERMINRANKAAPQAMRLLTQAMHDTELPMSLRARIAEFIVDKNWPKVPAGAELHIGGGVDFLELRFVAPGQPAAAAPETRRIPFDDRQGVGESMGQTIDAEEEDSNINDL